MVNPEGVPSGERGQVTDDNREQTNSPERVTGGETSATTSRRAFLAASGTGAALAMAGWVSLHTDGLTGRVYVDAPDGFAGEGFLRRFARSHDAGSIKMACHPSGETMRWDRPSAIRLDDG